MNDPNNGAASKPAPAEGREGRRAAKSNAGQPPAPRTQSRTRASMGLDGVREVARSQKAAGKEVRFTALMHHITPQLLVDSFMHLKKPFTLSVMKAMASRDIKISGVMDDTVEQLRRQDVFLAAKFKALRDRPNDIEALISCGVFKPAARALATASDEVLRIPSDNGALHSQAAGPTP